MSNFEKYFRHIEERKQKRMEEDKKWESVEDIKSNFFLTVAAPAMEELSKNSNKLHTAIGDAKEDHGVLSVTFKIIVLDNYGAPENRYELDVILNKYLGDNDLELHLKNYHTENMVEVIGNSSEYSKELLIERVEEMFIQLFDRDNS